MLQNLLTTKTVSFKRSQFANTKPDQDVTITIDCEEFRRFLTQKIKNLAVERCELFLREWMKRQGNDNTVGLEYEELVEEEEEEEEVDEEKEEEEGKPNVVWVGNIKTAFLERWKLNAKNKAVQY